MNHRSRQLAPGRRVVLLFSAMIFLIAGSAYAQYQTGNVYGTVTDKDGGSVPGATVTLSGPGAPQVFVTDTSGKFRFLNLSPGSYTLKAELSGLGEATRGDVVVNVGSNTDVSLKINPQISAEITVTGDTPLLDVRRTGTGSTVTKIEMQEVPTARDPWVVLQQVPGVLMDRINVGGNESGQQSSYVSKGASGNQATWNVDGVNITDMASMSSPSYYDFDSFEEMQATTGGTDPRIQTPGVQLNMVTKRGTNEFRGSGRYFFTSGDYQSDATVPSEAQSYLFTGNQINKIEDYGLEAGGALLRDHIWGWASYARNDIKNLTARPCHGFSGGTCTDIAIPYPDNTVLEDWNAKINGQLWRNNSATFLYTYGNKTKVGRNVGPTRPPETGWIQNGPTSLYKLEDTHIFSANFFLTGMVSKVDSVFSFTPAGGASTTAYQDYDGVWHNTFYYYNTDRPQDSYRADGSTFFDTGKLNHELKFGFGLRHTPSTSTSSWPSDYYIVFDPSVAPDPDNAPPIGTPGASGFIALTRNSDANYDQKYTDAYVGDTMLLGKLTLQAGARYDLQKGSNGKSVVAANRLAPDVLTAVTFDQSAAVKWTSISPRLGATYALGDKTLLRGSYNRYVDQLQGGTVSSAAPFAYYQYLYYYFTDKNGDRKASRDEIDFGSGPVAAYNLDINNPNSGLPFNRFDKNLKPPKTDEFILGAEHALLRDFTVGFNYTHRKLDDFVYNRAEKHIGQGDFYTSADYELGGYVNGTATGNAINFHVPYYQVKDGVPTPTFYVITNRNGYNQTYDGLELNATKRLSNRWMMRGNLSWSDWKQHVGANDDDPDPTHLLTPYGCSNCDGANVVQGSGSGSGAKGGVYINSKWSYVVTGLYELPWKVNVGASLQGRQGYPQPYWVRKSVDGINKNILIDGVDPQRHANVMDLDLRIAKEFKLGPVGATISLDAFNVTNERPVLQRNLRQNRSNTNRITELQSPRVLRLGARLNF